jgi:hypothetical protein
MRSLTVVGGVDLKGVVGPCPSSPPTPPLACHEASDLLPAIMFFHHVLSISPKAMRPTNCGLKSLKP